MSDIKTDWTCPKCGQKNIAKHYRCCNENCKATRDQGEPWICKKCGSANVPSFYRCSNDACKQLKKVNQKQEVSDGMISGIVQKQGDSEIIKQDWTCPKCGQANIAKHYRCSNNNCKNLRDPGEPWICKKCGTANIESFYRCSNKPCGQLKIVNENEDQNDGTKAVIESQPDSMQKQPQPNWVCEKCGKHNLGRWYRCNDDTCGNTRPHSGNRPNQNQRQWQQGQMNRHNQGKRQHQGQGQQNRQNQGGSANKKPRQQGPHNKEDESYVKAQEEKIQGLNAMLSNKMLELERMQAQTLAIQSQMSNLATSPPASVSSTPGPGSLSVPTPSVDPSVVAMGGVVAGAGGYGHQQQYTHQTSATSGLGIGAMAMPDYGSNYGTPQGYGGGDYRSATSPSPRSRIGGDEFMSRYGDSSRR